MTGACRMLLPQVAPGQGCLGRVTWADGLVIRWRLKCRARCSAAGCRVSAGWPPGRSGTTGRCEDSAQRSAHHGIG